MARTVEILVLKGSFPSTVAITFDVFTTANRLLKRAGRPPGFKLRAIGSGARRARAFVGGIDASGPADVIVVPGLGLTNHEELVAGLGQPDAKSAARTLVAAHEAGIALAAGCSGVFLLASAGLLAGRCATTTWWLAPLFRQLHPNTRLDSDKAVVTDGLITTAGAAMAQLDLTLALIARYGSRSLADTCARYLLLDQRRSQSRYMAVSFFSASDDNVARAERWARERLSESFSVDDMATAAGLSPRTFARRVVRATGHSPIKLLQRLRIERALELVETTRLPFDEIARQVGYAEGSTLRGILRTNVGGSVRALRAA